MLGRNKRWNRWAAWVLIGVFCAWMVGALAPTAAQTPPPATDPPAKSQDDDAESAQPQDKQPEQAEPSDKVLESAAAKLQREGAAPSKPTEPPVRPATTPAPSTTPATGPAAHLGLWVLAPALVTIVLSILTQQVIPALVVGIFVGAYMMLFHLPPSDAYTQQNVVIGGFRLAMERYILGAVVDEANRFSHAKIIVFTLSIGFLIGVLGKNGGADGMVNLVTGGSDSRRRGGLTASIAGLVVFFDDYANCMIIGPTMQPVFDRLKLSRAKLAYIVDSTAAPVASLALIGTWVGTEIGYIDQGLKSFTERSAPAFLLDGNGQVLSGMTAFIQSLPYRFYPIFAIILVLLISWTERDFGPMKRSERKAMNNADAAPPPVSPLAAHMTIKTAPPNWLLGFLPVAALVAVTLILLVAGGLSAEKTTALMEQTGPGGWSEMAWWRKAATAIGNSDSYIPIFYGAVVAVIIAVISTLATRSCTIRTTFDAGVDGMGRVFPALVILVLAWGISTVMQNLELGRAVEVFLKAQQFQAMWLPLAIFLAACVISFATGTSWGTMGILCPMTVEIAARLATDLPTKEALTLFYAAVGSVLAGAVFGDHCSPISDTTVLSSLSSGCRHEEHVWTQLPYALLAAIAGIGSGEILCSVYKQPWYYGIAAGTVFMVLVVFLIGRKPVSRAEPVQAV